MHAARIFCVHLFTCNRPGDTGSGKNDAAFWERWEYLTFPNLFEVDRLRPCSDPTKQLSVSESGDWHDQDCSEW